MSTSLQEGKYARKWWVLLAVCLALFMVMLDATVVNVSVPAISQGLGATFAQAEWVLNAYTLVFASLLVTCGRLGDMFGRKRFFMIGLGVFGIGSLLCGLATTPAFLIAARAFQAFGAAFMMPATLSLTAVSFPANERGMAMGIWGAVSGVATAAGPLLGGVLTDAFSWRYIFFINLPVVLLAIPFTLWAVPENRDEHPHKVDWLGSLLSVALLGSLCYGLIQGPDWGWTDSRTLTYFGVALVVLVMFLIWERRAEEPIMDLRLFRHSAFSAGSASGAVLMFGMMGMFFLLPMYLSGQLGYSAADTGLAMTPMSGAILLSAPMAGKVSDKIGSRWLIFAGMLTAALAVFWLSFLPAGAEWQWLAAPLILAGVGMGLVMAPMTSAVMAVAPRGEEGAASGILSTMRQVGGVFGVAVLGAVFSTGMVSGMVNAVSSVKGLPAQAVPYVQAAIEDAEFGMGTSGMDSASLRSEVPTEAMMPLFEQAVTDASEASLPAAMQQPVADAVMETIAAGGTLDSEMMMQRLGQMMPATAAMPMSGAQGAESAEMFADFGTAVGENIESGFEDIGEGFADAAESSFLGALRDAFRLASIILVVGAFLALLVKKGQNVESSLEAIRARDE